MSLADTVRKAVAIADKVTKPLQATITRQIYSGQIAGVDQYDSTVEERAFVDNRQHKVRLFDGQETLARVSITYIVPVQVGLHDKITLANGVTGPILDVNGFEDAGDSLHRAFVTEVFLG